MQELRDRQVWLVHELMYQIKVREVMTKEVICFPSTATFREIQLCMKARRFSGTPIVDGGELVGMVSIEDIISAFDKGRIDQPVAPHMTRNVVTIPQNYSVIGASNIFDEYGFGRLPVVSEPNSRRIVGIVTVGDILRHLLLEVNSIAERFEEKQARLATGAEKVRDTWRFELAPDDFELAGLAATTVKKRLQEYGLSPALIRRIAVICYEAEMNVIIHSLGGYLEVQLGGDRVRILAVKQELAWKKRRELCWRTRISQEYIWGKYCNDIR